jgi:uncharacterized damage-inducible protein DinB
MTETKQSEPWLRGTLGDVPAVARAVLHALQLAEEDLEKWCGALSDAQLNARPDGVAPVAFQIRHIARSVERLLTYAEGRQLSEAQLEHLRRELEPGASAAKIFAELKEQLRRAEQRIRALAATEDLEAARAVGRRALPTTVGGLLVHVADHTQRHTGQAITTAKIVRASAKEKRA